MNLSKALNEEVDKLMLVQRQGYYMRKMLTILKNLELFDMTGYKFNRMNDEHVWHKAGCPDAEYYMAIYYNDENNQPCVWEKYL